MLSLLQRHFKHTARLSACLTNTHCAADKLLSSFSTISHERFSLLCILGNLKFMTEFNYRSSILPWLCLCCGQSLHSVTLVGLWLIEKLWNISTVVAQKNHTHTYSIYIYGAKWRPLCHCGFTVLTYSTDITKCDYFGIVFWKMVLKYYNNQ